MADGFSYTAFTIIKIGQINTWIQIDDFRLYQNVLLSINDIATICGNNKLYTYSLNPVLLNTLFDFYDASTACASATGYLIKNASGYVDLNCIYKKYTSGNYVSTTYIVNSYFKPTQISGVIISFLQMKVSF